MDELEPGLNSLVETACKHPPGSPERQKSLTRVIRQTSKKLWHESTPYYADALQKTWLHFCENVCKLYDPSRGSVITWLNNYLKWRLRDGFIATQAETARRASSQAALSRSGEPGDTLDPIDRLPAHPDVPPILVEVQAWAEADATGELSNLHIKGYPQITCQLLILRRLPPESSWKDLSAEFGAPIPTLSAFYQRQCLPRLRKFGESAGYL
jgi:hypothetical protein